MLSLVSFIGNTTFSSELSEENIIEVEELFPKTESLNIIEDTAVITLTIMLKGKFRGVYFEEKYRYIRLWKNIENQLKVIGGSCILLLH